MGTHEGFGFPCELVGEGVVVQLPQPFVLLEWIEGLLELCVRVYQASADLVAASIYHAYSVRPSIRPLNTRCCFTTTNKIEVCSTLRCARAFIIKYRPDAICHMLSGGFDRARRSLISSPLWTL